MIEVRQRDRNPFAIWDYSALTEPLVPYRFGISNASAVSFPSLIRRSARSLDVSLALLTSLACYFRFDAATYFLGAGPTYSALGRMMRLSCSCSRMWADQPLMRLHANSAGIMSGWKPRV